MRIVRRGALGQALASFVWIGLVASCDSGTSVDREFADVRLSKGSLAERASTAERFGLRSGAAKPASQAQNGLEQARAALEWTTPTGWEERPPSAMRLVSFQVGAADCALTLLAGDAGGLKANVDRWRGQIGLPALGAAELEALPTTRFFDADAVLFDARGTYKGMSGGPVEDARLLGVLLVDPRGSAFLKFVGPASVVDAHVAAFTALAASIRPKRATSEGSSSANGFSFDLPAGWSRGADKPTRVLDFAAGEGLDCGVTVLAGDGGGLGANVNRWRGQLGLPALTHEEIDALPMLAMLRGNGRYVEIENDDQAIVGALAIGVERSTFVKLSGPRERVLAQRDAFRALCASLAGESP